MCAYICNLKFVQNTHTTKLYGHHLIYSAFFSFLEIPFTMWSELFKSRSKISMLIFTKNFVQSFSWISNCLGNMASKGGLISEGLSLWIWKKVQNQDPVSYPPKEKIKRRYLVSWFGTFFWEIWAKAKNV